MVTTFRVWLAELLSRWAAWVAIPVPPPPPDPLLEAAKRVVAVVGSHTTRIASRHNSLVKNLMATRLLRQAFPDTRTRDIKFAIEMALKLQDEANPPTPGPV